MYRNRTTLGIITARGGSKGIPRKNIKDLCGKPLIAYTIAAARESTLLTRCIVSTDDAEIASVARAAGGDVPFLRPDELATDTASSLAVAQHALRMLHDAGEWYDYAMILQPTSPLRTAADIDACIAMIVDTDADSVMSVVELADFAPKKIKRIADDALLPYFGEGEGKTSARRQTLEPAYKRNCAIYLTRASCVMEGDLFGAVSRPYVMPEERSVDINAPVDFAFAEFFLTRARAGARV